MKDPISKKQLRNMTREEQIALADELIDRDAATWKEYIRRSDMGLDDIISQRHLGLILTTRQR